MRLTLHSDLAIRTLFSLATVKRDGVNISEIAKIHSASENHLRKVVYHLVQAGLVETTRGRGGGLRLAVSPSEITIGAVIRKMEADFALADCLGSHPERCFLAGFCGLQKLLAEALEAWFEVLDQRTLAEAIAASRGLSNRSASRSSDYADR